MHLNENHFHDTLKISKRIQLITRFNLLNDKYASENFKIMNYGMAGKVQAHWDSVEKSGKIEYGLSKSILKFHGSNFWPYI